MVTNSSIVVGVVVNYDLPMLNHDLPMLNYDRPCAYLCRNKRALAPKVVVYDLPLGPKTTIQTRNYRS